MHLRTDLSPPPKVLASSGLLHPEDLVEVDSTTPSKIHTCFKGLRKVTRLLIRHARNLRRMRYGKALLRIFLKKPSVALKSILCATEGEQVTTSLPIEISLILDETTGRLITTPDEVVAKIVQMEIVALSPDPSLPLRAHFPWLGHVRSTPLSSLPNISSCITSAIMQEALRRTPSHKTTRPCGVPRLVLKHTPLYFTRLYTSYFHPCRLRVSHPLLGSKVTRLSSTKKGTSPKKGIASRIARSLTRSRKTSVPTSHILGRSLTSTCLWRTLTPTRRTLSSVTLTSKVLSSRWTTADWPAYLTSWDFSKTSPALSLIYTVGLRRSSSYRMVTAPP